MLFLLSMLRKACEIKVKGDMCNVLSIFQERVWWARLAHKVLFRLIHIPTTTNFQGQQPPQQQQSPISTTTTTMLSMGWQAYRCILARAQKRPRVSAVPIQGANSPGLSRSCRNADASRRKVTTRQAVQKTMNQTFSLRSFNLLRRKILASTYNQAQCFKITNCSWFQGCKLKVTEERAEGAVCRRITSDHVFGVVWTSWWENFSVRHGPENGLTAANLIVRWHGM